MRKIHYMLLSTMIAAAGVGVAFTTTPGMPEGSYGDNSAPNVEEPSYAGTGKDIAVLNITAPETVTPGNSFDVAVTLKTVGTVASSSHKLALYVNGVAVETQTPPTLPVDSTQVVNFTVATQPLDVDPYIVYAKATLTRDDDATNNVSDTITVKAVLSTLPKATDLTASGDMNKVTLKWTAAQAGTNELKGYNVWCNKKLMNETPVTATEYVDNAPAMGNSYCVTAVYANGQSAASNYVTPEITLPNGAGTEANPYTISTPKEFQFFLGMTRGSTCEGQYFRQLNDIDFENELMLLEASSYPFAGNYDGGNFTLKHLNLKSSGSQYAAMIGYVGEKGKISNLVLEGKAAITAAYNAPLAAYMYGTIENVISKVSITSSASTTGGIASETKLNALFKNCEYAGTMDNSANYASCGGITGRTNHGTFVNCKFTGKIINPSGAKNVSYVGGIAGYAYPSTFIGCYSNGELPTDTLGDYRGGIVGFSYASNAAANCGKFTYKNCVNYTYIKGNTYLAGISGYVAFMKATGSSYKNKSYLEVDSCVNYADIHGSGANLHVGGIIGSYTMSSTISNCVNYGNISTYNGYGFGGIAGAYMETPTDSTRSSFTKCINYGSVKNLIPSKNVSYSGGIIGDLNAYTTISECENYGEIVANGYAGGISGYNYFGPTVIEKCTNNANIIGAYHTLGGVSGFFFGVDNVISDCVNHGNVTSLNTDSLSYGIGGIAGTTATVVQNCLNTGNLTGADYVGGVAGYVRSGKLNIHNNLNTGTILARKIENKDTTMDVNACGPILGIALDNESFWNMMNDRQLNNFYTPNVLSNYKTTEDYLSNQAGTEISFGELVNTNKLGDAWKAYDKYCWPVPAAALQDDNTKVWAAQVVPGKESESLDRLTNAFHVGAPEGLVWTSNPDLITFQGTEATISKNAKNDNVVLTATCGKYTKSITVGVDVSNSLDSLETDDAVEVTWYNMQGVRVEAPTIANGNVYIMLRRYANGTVKAIKVMN